MHTNYIRVFINCMCEVQVLISVTAASKVTTRPHAYKLYTKYNIIFMNAYKLYTIIY